MANTAIYTVKIDSLPEETIEAASPQEAARKAGALIADNESLRRLHDEEPVEIKRPDGRPWGRNLTIGAFRRGEVADSEEPDGPVHPPSV